MGTVIVIPSRYGSTRLPGKPLVLVNNKSLLYRVWRIAKAVKSVDQVYVTTDDVRIQEHAASFGAEVIMTSPDCRTGTDRVVQAMEQLPTKPDAVINLQGDAVLTPPWVIQALVDLLHSEPTVQMVTPAVALTLEQYEALRSSKSKGQVGGTTVTFDRKGNALYFSKSLIPYVRPSSLPPPIFRHIGLYGYRMFTLQRFAALEPGVFEEAEKLEQLRALENGIPIRIVIVDYRGRTHCSIDSEEDVTRAEALIEKEGELIEGI